MLPYPSGTMHMGHMRNYTIGDVVARFRRMRGFNVLHPMGWDAFGLPAENAAIKNNTHPRDWTNDNIAEFKRTLRRFGFSYDWRREISTCEPEYYRWNQWFFLRMLERGLAYRKKSRVNWCPKCGTVLANEQVIKTAAAGGTKIRLSKPAKSSNGSCAPRLRRRAARRPQQLEGSWPERVLTMQRNWIGKSQRHAREVRRRRCAGREADRNLHHAHRHDLRRVRGDPARPSRRSKSSSAGPRRTASNGRRLARCARARARPKICHGGKRGLLHRPLRDESVSTARKSPSGSGISS